jgi:hypothetical protein
MQAEKSGAGRRCPPTPPTPKVRELPSHAGSELALQDDPPTPPTEFMSLSGMSGMSGDSQPGPT